MLPIIIGSTVGVSLFVLLVLLIAKVRNSQSDEREIERNEARQNSYSANARIIKIVRAEIQRDKSVETYKLLLEVFPINFAPEFSATVVWEIEQSAIGPFQNGAVIPVKFNPLNAREIFPDLNGGRYSYRFQNALLGIEDQFETVQTVAQTQLAPKVPKSNTIYRKRSKVKLFGMPLWEIAFNLQTSKKYRQSAKARAMIAIGDSATGIIAIGSFAKGLISIGHLSLGVFSFGGLSLGLFSFGLLACGLAAFGSLAGGLLSLGAISGGYVSVGLLAIGKYIFALDYQNNPWLRGVYQNLKQITGLSDDIFGMIMFAFLVLNFAVFGLSFVVKVIATNSLTANDNSLESPCFLINR